MLNLLFGRPAQKIVNYTGLLATCAFGFFAWLSTAGANVALVALFVSFLLCAQAWSTCRRAPLIGMFIISAVYVCFRSSYAAIEFPESRALQIKDASNWMKLFAFLPLAWWLNGDIRRINSVLLLAVFGLIAGMLMHVNWHSLLHMNIAERTGFKLKIIFSGLISGTVILGMLVFAPRIIGPEENPLRLPRLIAWLIGLYLAMYMLLSSYSRGAWLATICATSLTVFFRYKKSAHATNGSQEKATSLYLLIAAFAVLCTIGLLNAEKIQSRINAEQGSVASFLQGEAEGAQSHTSIAFRLNVQAFGLRKWLERPWLGWGTGSTEYLIAHSESQLLLHPTKNGVDWMDHLHNTYLEILLRFGIAGALILALVTLLLLKGVIRSYRSGLIPRDYFLFLAGAFGLLAIWSLFDFRALHADWRAYWILLAGVAYTFQLRDRKVAPSTIRPA